MQMISRIRRDAPEPSFLIECALLGIAIILCAAAAAVGAQTTITPYTQVNNGAWQVVNAATVNPGDTVNLGPQPKTGGTWSWTGPNGFTSTQREIDAVPLPLPTDVYTATFTPTAGTLPSSEVFTVTVNSTPLTPHIQVNGGAWQTTTAVTVNGGDVVNLGPQPQVTTGWSWSGPNGFTSTSRAIYGIALPSASNLYAATYTNASGVTSTVTFTITAGATPITPWIQVNGGAWQQEGSVTVNPGDVVNLGPWPNGVTAGWSWAGPSGFTSSLRVLNAVPLTQGANVYTATYTNPYGLKSSFPFTVTVGSYSVDLGWLAPNDQTDPVTSYSILRANHVTGGGAETFQQIGSTTNRTFTDTTVGQQPGAQYDYAVESVDAKGNYSPMSNVAGVVIP